jgi:pimeloyl-ACP methyl ester carboxylesterase
MRERAAHTILTRHRLSLVLVCLAVSVVPMALSAGAQTATGALEHRRHQPGCAAVGEMPLFFAWHRIAGQPHTINAQDVEPLAFTASDQLVLHGYRVACCVAGARSTSKGYLLFAQGNAMLAGDIIEDYLRPLARASTLDVFVYDFRGYGVSPGTSHASDIISDYRELRAHLATLGYAHEFFYGISFGGAILLNAITGPYDGFVVDSTPSGLPFFCRGAVAPLRNLPSDASSFLLISGARDHTVSRKDMHDLLDVAQSRLASVALENQMGHPLTGDGDQRRLRLVVDFIKAHIQQ